MLDKTIWIYLVFYIFSISLCIYYLINTSVILAVLWGFSMLFFTISCCILLDYSHTYIMYFFCLLILQILWCADENATTIFGITIFALSFILIKYCSSTYSMPSVYKYSTLLYIIILLFCISYRYNVNS